MRRYNKNNITLAKNLRKNMTRWEKKLWFDFLKDYELRFQRQKAIGNYIADFYCAKAGLIIELDGEWHFEEEQSDKDIIRSEYFEQENIKVIRFTNLEVEKKFDWVCECIDVIVKTQIKDKF